MAVSYKKLWKLLIDKGLNKTQLCAEAGITTNEDVRVEVLVKICSALNCTMDDIMEIIPDHDIQQRRLRE